MFFIQGLNLVQNIFALHGSEQNSSQVKQYFTKCISMLEVILNWPFSQEGLI